MNWLDFVILIFLIVSVIGGIANGLIKSVLSFLGLIIGIVLAGRFYLSMADHLGFISSEKTAQIVAFIIIFLIVTIIAGILGWLLTKIISATPLGIINRLLGGLFGLIAGFVSIGAILALWVHFAGQVDVISNSALASFLVDKFPLVLALLPNEFDSVRNYFK
jgi:membrane protein required for colicin V production